MFNSVHMSSDFVVYNIQEKKFRKVMSKNANSDQIPLPRYDHSIIQYRVVLNYKPLSFLIIEEIVHVWWSD